MKLGKQRPSGKDSKSWYKKGEYKGYTVTVNWSDEYGVFHFQIAKGSDSYSSVWDDNTFKTENECIKACEVYIEEVVNG